MGEVSQVQKGYNGHDFYISLGTLEGQQFPITWDDNTCRRLGHGIHIVLKSCS